MSANDSRASGRRALLAAAVAVMIWMPTSVANAAPATQAPIVRGVVGLSRGASGNDVKSVQTALMAAGVSVPGGADGHFGPATQNAIVEFQRRSSLTQTGTVDAATAAALGIAPAASAAPAAISSGTVFGGLQQGASGAVVKELQTKLIAFGVYVAGGADGQFGPATATAVKHYQTWNGLNSSGYVDAATASKLGLTGASGTSSQPAVAPAAPAPAVTPAIATTPEATPDASAYVGLHVGNRGPLVKDLQNALVAAGISVRGGADGIFGLATKAALESYQQAEGLGVSGVLYEATVAKLGLGGAPSVPATQPASQSASEPPAAAVSTNPYVGLTVGDRGELVKDLQTALMGTGLVVHGGADGVFGGATKSALVAFQGVNGITPTGAVTETGAGILSLGTSAPAAIANGIINVPDGYPIKGEASDRVRILQQQLIAWGITVVGGADGSFGNATAAAIKNFQETHGLTVTGTVTQETADKMGLASSDATPTASASDVSLVRFPVQGTCYFGNTWHAPRGGGRVHEGVDIIATQGKLLYAVADGTISKQYWDYPGALAGNGLRLAQDDGTYFTYLHLSGFAEGIEVGTKVLAGDVIGFVGNTGSSATSHLHFEIHPGGGGAVNPYPYVRDMDDCQNSTAQYQSSFAPA